MPSILITGASRGIGYGLAKRYSGAGWDVIATTRDAQSAEKLRAISSNVSTIILDVSSPRSIGKMRRKLRGVPLDVLVNNAGIDISERRKKGCPKIPVYNHCDLQNIFQVNAIAPYAITAALLDNILLGSLRKVVCISSRLAQLCLHQDSRFLAYKASKAALNSVVTSLSFALKESGVTVVAVHPGHVITSLGGSDAILTVDECANHLHTFIEKVALHNGGMFLDTTIETLPT